MSESVPDGASDPHADRLDSWKAIAEYLGRDIRTVMRWESERKLPVRRVPGGRGRTVFALSTEIDAWLARAEGESVAPPVDRTVVPSPDQDVVPSRRTAPRVRLASAIAVVALGAFGIWWWQSARLQARSVIAGAEADPSGVTAWNATRERLWFLPFPPGRRMMLTAEPATVVRDLDGDGRLEVLVGVAQTLSADHVDGSGELFSVSASGQTLWRFTSNENLRLGARTYSGPWPIATWTIAPDTTRLQTAVSVHDFTWWPSVLYVLDDRGAVSGRFVNAGWMGSLAWIDTPTGRRLVAGGISNSQAAGVVAVLDPAHLNGRSPETAGSAFECHNCPAGDAIAYMVFPRSELNRVTGSSFNQARVFASADGFTVRTEEVSLQAAQADGGIEVIYRFTQELDMIGASFGDRYWDLHRRLEQDGRIHHARDRCPDRDGPREIRVWQPATGWRTQILR